MLPLRLTGIFVGMDRLAICVVKCGFVTGHHLIADSAGSLYASNTYIERLPSQGKVMSIFQQQALFSMGIIAGGSADEGKLPVFSNLELI